MCGGGHRERSNRETDTVAQAMRTTHVCMGKKERGLRDKRERLVGRGWENTHQQTGHVRERIRCQQGHSVCVCVCMCLGKLKERTSS